MAACPTMTHAPKIVGTTSAHLVLRWSHRVFSNLKRWALGTFHGLRRPHLRRYLDEFGVPLEPPPPHRNGLRRPARYRHAPATRRLPRHRRTTRLIPPSRPTPPPHSRLPRSGHQIPAFLPASPHPVAWPARRPRTEPRKTDQHMA